MKIEDLCNMEIFNKSEFKVALRYKKFINVSQRWKNKYDVYDKWSDIPYKMLGYTVISIEPEMAYAGYDEEEYEDFYCPCLEIVCEKGNEECGKD